MSPRGAFGSQPFIPYARFAVATVPRDKEDSEATWEGTMKLAIALPTGFAVVLLTTVGLALLISSALSLDIDLAIFFACQFGGILVVLAIFYFVAERLHRHQQ